MITKKITFVDKPTNIIYHSTKYSNDHWANRYPEQTDDDFIYILEIEQSKYLVKLNPTDSRGYRVIIKLIHDQMESTLNRPYTIYESTGLMYAASIVAHSLQKIGVIVQIEVAGNNSQKLVDGKIIIGNDTEPSFLHAHIICRGDPEFDYVKGVTLKGPVVGELFDMRGTSNNPGNKRKEKWAPDEMKLVATRFQDLVKMTLVENGHI